MFPTAQKLLKIWEQTDADVARSKLLLAERIRMIRQKAAEAREAIRLARERVN